MDEITERKPSLSKQPKKKNNEKSWVAKTTRNRLKLFEDPEVLWEACVEYFQWVEDNPLLEDRPFHYQGRVVHEPIAKMRAMTLSGVCLFLGITTETWRNYRSDPVLGPTVARADQVIFNQKFAGASADLLNANIIARELGLAEKQEHDGLVKILVAQTDADLM